MHTLIVRHEPDSSPPRFTVIRQKDGKCAPPVAVTPPLAFPVEGRPDSNLLNELPWYLEDFLDYPFPPHTDRAENVTAALEAWGREAFNDLFSSRQAGEWFQEATRDGYENLCLQIMSDDPLILQWPWEALLDPQATWLAVSSLIERRLNEVRDPVPLPEELPRDIINILLVTCRPYEEDIHYRSISRPLVELIEKKNIPARVHVLRPPTFASLREHLEERPHFYHIIHFDGHGGYGASGSHSNSAHVFKGEGVLVFEDSRGKPDNVPGEKLSGLLRKHAVPIIVLNACQSAMLDQNAADPFASVAAALLKAGIRGVAAMAYSLYVSGAQEFLPDFYLTLFHTGDISQATCSGRRKMFGQSKRVCARGRYELKDFVVPVIYRQEAYRLPFSTPGDKPGKVAKVELPEEAGDQANPYGFIGRDREILKLERAMRRITPAILIHGLGGSGKTTLARGFLKWLRDTEGMDGCLWLTFLDIRSAEYVVNYLGSALFGQNFLSAGMEQKIEALTSKLRETRLVIVWDNFEAAAGIPGTSVTANLTANDRGLLLSLLSRLRGGKSKVVITSRSEEEWLGIERLKLSIGGLEGEERWEYCQAILDSLGLSIERSDPDLAGLMNFLKGHPLAMRVILPKLEKMRAGQVIEALRSNMEALGAGAEPLYATLRLAVESLSGELKALLIPLALCEGYVDARMLEYMAGQVDKRLEKEPVHTFLEALAAAGLLRNIKELLYELHPALTGYLRSTTLKETPPGTGDKWSRAFVEVMGSLANSLGPRPLHEQRPGFLCHGANFRFALAEAARLGMDQYQAALIQALASYALNNRNFSEARELYESFARMRSQAGDEIREATAYYQLGRIAREQRDFKSAENWYLKSLAIDEKLGYEHGAAQTYHQLGMLAGEQRDFQISEKWYLKAIVIFEKYKKEEDAATTYHQMGIIAGEQREFQTAERWYLKSLAIEEKQGNEHGTAITYYQLGITAHYQRDFKAAEKWYLKSLTINEKLGDEYGAALTYHQLGIIAEEQRDFQAAEKWYLKSLAINEKLGDEYLVAQTYHELGILAWEQGDIQTAEKWYFKSLAIAKKLSDEHGASSTYHQLGIIAQERRDFKTAEKWYLKSCEISEKVGNKHGAALTYGLLSTLAGLQDNFKESGEWLIKCLKSFKNCNDTENVEKIINCFLILYRSVPEAEKARLKEMWDKAGLGTFPDDAV